LAAPLYLPGGSPPSRRGPANAVAVAVAVAVLDVGWYGTLHQAGKQPDSQTAIKPDRQPARYGDLVRNRGRDPEST